MARAGPAAVAVNVSGRSSRTELCFLCSCCIVLGGVGISPAVAASNKVRVTQLSDVSFGLVTNTMSDSSNSQSLCIYSDTASSGYNVRAIGSGSGGAFTLSSASSNLPYDVEWNSTAGQSNGAALTPNVALSGQVSQAKQQTCNSGPATSASLIVIIRSAALTSADAGFYSGDLTLVIGPE